MSYFGFIGMTAEQASQVVAATGINGAATIPDAHYIEEDGKLLLFCPFEGCRWDMPYTWDEMTANRNRPDEFLKHYREEHND